MEHHLNVVESDPRWVSENHRVMAEVDFWERSLALAKRRLFTIITVRKRHLEKKDQMLRKLKTRAVDIVDRNAEITDLVRQVKEMRASAGLES